MHTANERCHLFTHVAIPPHVIARTYRVLLSLPDLQKEQSVRAAKQTVVARQRPSQVPVAVQSVRATKQSGMRFVPASLPSADRLGTQAFTQRSTHAPHTHKTQSRLSSPPPDAYRVTSGSSGVPAGM